MRKTIKVVFLLIILGAMISYSDDLDFRLWQAATEEKKFMICYLMLQGFLGAIVFTNRMGNTLEDFDFPGKPQDSLHYAAECMGMVVPFGTDRADFLREIIYRIELQYLQEDHRELSLAIVFSNTLVEAWEKTFE